jgi:hypothetical protein
VSRTRTVKKRALTKSATKRTKPVTVKKRTIRDASGGEDRKSARKFRRGGRIEAYTMGEALSSKNWP